ncbi:Fe2+-dependent dioxygenase [Phormidium tenue]|uniref:Fe2+-dependent dioxygenase n=1 Tax=Phormidium tenue NIES-30 TaxID=549789 RepID=A0A1U7J028_9CYAN|nr:Fe2+-dependent dioxygenase [Phormidium tenue]MBD2231673.1 Fe2+-dependent dioxygenase [Phormidium tenue FACHB-1052]OKH44826.1 Fe2+-dependent dioxygenase [Phormidium tenue NIES-30]
MIVCIADLLTPDEVAQIKAGLAQAAFVPGETTAGWHAKLVKQNEQAAKQAAVEPLKAVVQNALVRNALFQAIACPRIIHSLLFSRYGVGMSYGRHTDNALMGGANFYRSDVSLTVFLSEPDDYDGGELVIEGADSEQPYKLAAGSAIVYPSTTLHWVEPVVRGDRMVAVGWVQSLVRDAARREILFDLETVKRTLFAQTGKTPEFDLLTKTTANLLRQWAE